MIDDFDPTAGFAGLGLTPEVLRALNEVGYETPSSIQAQCIPHMMQGRDLVGQAQTGTGKTGAFALPILSKLHLPDREPQALVLTPTRELAIQVAEAFQRYAAFMPDFHVLPVYGGQAYGAQLKPLKRGVHVIVATPGRLVDHLKRGTIKLDALETLVIDEADEMLRMGFIEEVEWILQQTPPTRQVSLFSATMPPAIRRIAEGYLQNAVSVTIHEATATAATIYQRYWMVSGVQKLDALTRILEGEEFDGMIVFVRTKTATVDLTARLQARGFAAEALNGDIAQNQREAVVERLKGGDVDILVATDVAARGLDVSRVSHVVNYDIPYDTEAYIHRIGRTGRAGRAGNAILFVAPRERRLLHSIERATGQRIELMRLPTVASINDARISKFKARITEMLATEDLGFYFQLVEQYRQENNVPALEIAAALAIMAQGENPLLLPARQEEPDYESERPRPSAPAERSYADRQPSERPSSDRHSSERASSAAPRSKPARQSAPELDIRSEGRECFRIEVGREHGVKPGAIVGAIANEAGITGKLIGSIEIYDDYSTVVLPSGLPEDVITTLEKVRISGQPLRIKSMGPSDERPPRFMRKDDGERGSDRGSDRGDRGGDRGDRPKYSPRGDREDRPSFKKSFGDKPAYKKPSGDKPPYKKAGEKPGGFKKSVGKPVFGKKKKKF